MVVCRREICAGGTGRVFGFSTGGATWEQPVAS